MNRDAEPRRNIDVTLQRVCWGYRDIFKRTIKRLHEEGYLGDDRPEVTELFYSCIECSDSSLFDHVLKEFLEAFGRPIAWMLDLPEIFERVVRTGCSLAERKLHFGIRFFRLLGEGGFGDTPESVHRLLGWIDSLLEIDEDLAAALLGGYGYLSSRLSGEQLDRYIRLGIEAYERNRRAGIRYLEATVAGVETIISSLTSEARLDEEKPDLERLFRALSGRHLPFDGLSSLDSDELILRGSTVVAFVSGVYVPDRITAFEDTSHNRSWYLLQCALAAAMYRHRSFPTIHGAPGIESIEDLEPDIFRRNLLTLVEYARVVAAARREWPGVNSIVDWAVGVELERGGPGYGKLERFALDLFSPNGGEAGRALPAETFDRCSSIAETVDHLDEISAELSAEARGLLGARPMGAFSFLPDFGFSGEISPAEAGNLAVDTDEGRDTPEGSSDDETRDEEEATEGSATYTAVTPSEDEERETEAGGIAYAYDEWCHRDHDYFRDYCLVREVTADADETGRIPAPPTDELARVRRVFEMIRPDAVHVEKRLEEGDEIDHERLVEYLVDREVDPSPKVSFYSKPLIKLRDLSVLILIDSSGSTADPVHGRDSGDRAAGRSTEAGAGDTGNPRSGDTRDPATVLDVEKQAALMLGEGLSALGDRFALCGFSGSGREDCRFYRYKDFSEPWDASAVVRLQAARSHQATRIGAALRHAGYLMGKETSKRKLLLLITDGRPMDTEYDPESGYAQRDVRMACEENRREGIHTYCISTLENSRADMQTMFPGNRFVILDNLHQLPALLPRLYVRLTS